MSELPDEVRACHVHADGWHRSLIIARSTKAPGADHTCACWLPSLYPDGRRRAETTHHMMWNGAQVVEMPRRRGNVEVGA